MADAEKKDRKERDSGEKNGKGPKALAEETPKSASDRLREAREKIASFRPEPEERIPDIGLYMDQVLAFMERQHVGFVVGESGETLTASMIHNYVKKGILPRADGKRYGRGHLCEMTALCLLKQIVSVEECGVLLGALGESGGSEKLYARLTDLLAEDLPRAAERIDPEGSRAELADQALELAVSAYAEMLACRLIVQALREPENGASKSGK